MVDGINPNNSIASYSGRVESTVEQTASQEKDENIQSIESDKNDSFNVSFGEGAAQQDTTSSVRTNLSINSVSQPPSANSEKQADLKAIENEIRKAPGVAIEVQANQSVDAVVDLVS